MVPLLLVGDGQSVLFWRDRWIGGRSAADIAPGITLHISNRNKNARTIAQAMRENKWIRDISGTLATRGARVCVALWNAINSVHRQTGEPDKLSWPWNSSGTYTTSSTYRMLCQGRVRFELGTEIWSSKATPKAKLFMWLAVQHRIWTADRRMRHGLQPQSSACYVCLQEEDTAEHLLMQCVLAREVWHKCRVLLGLQFEAPLRDSTVQQWWSVERGKFRDKERHWFDSLVCTAGHALWKNRNAWCFNNVHQQRSTDELTALILDEFYKLKAVHRSGDGVFDNG
ncbi:uncharacterized protein LOC124685957 [Lolium rigidum]|uniref:uncharacterized protein LOC124685957 n=1 Tax=Lolium rigidum TaxID=89674 RepID=UPI001F5DA2BB|nr:uncharacterized protein LOC124685957 [Lolium rigidum]